MESGVGERAAKVIYDRAGSSFAEIKTNEWSEAIFKDVALFHVSGITPALSETWRDLTLSLVKRAKKQVAKSVSISIIVANCGRQMKPPPF